MNLIQFIKTEFMRLFSFIEDLDDFFLSFLEYVKSHINQEIASGSVLLIVLIAALYLQKKVNDLISKEDKKYKSYTHILNGLIFPFLFLLFTGIAENFLSGESSLSIFRAIAYFYLGFFIVRNLLDLLKINELFWNIASYNLLSVSVLSILIVNLNNKFFLDSQIHNAFFLLFKISLILLTYIFLFKGIRSIISLLLQRFNRSKRFFENLITFIFVVYFILSFLWVLKIIQFSSSFLIGIVLSLVAFVLYSLLRAYLKTYVQPRMEATRGNYTGLDSSINLFLNLVLVFMLYKIFKLYFDLDFFTSYLKNIYVLKTDLILISFFSLISAAFVFALLFCLLNILKHVAFFYSIKRDREVTAGSMRAVVSNLGILLIIPIALSELGLTWKALLPVAGALGLGVGIGLQNVMNNYISGFILLFSKKLKVGDIIEIDGIAGRAIGNSLETIYGKVKSIDTFSVVLSTTDGIDIVVPNSQFISGQIVNYSLSDYYIRIRIPFGVSYASDPNTIKEILLKIANENSKILKKPEPQVWFSEMADSAIVFHLLCWVNIRLIWKLNPLISDIYFKGWYELEKADVVIPFPQRDFWFKNNLKIELDKETIDELRKESKSEDSSRPESEFKPLVKIEKNPDPEKEE